MIADTTFLIDLGRGDTGALKKINELNANNDPLAITAITIFELFQGSNEFGTKNFKIFTTLAGNALVIPLEHDTAKAAGIINRNLSKAGAKLEALDCLIAGIVLLGNDVLLTRNLKHFSRIEGLKLETY